MISGAIIALRKCGKWQRQIVEQLQISKRTIYLWVTTQK